MTNLADRYRPAGPRDELDFGQVRADFPALAQQIRGRPLVYLDNAATAQKPRAVMEAIAHHYSDDYANVHRGVHYLSERATEHYEGARRKIARFLNAKHSSEIVFVRGTTEAINLVAHTFGVARIGAGDEILITALEHHSNIVPWQLLCQRTGAVLKVAPVDERGALLVDEFEKRLNKRTKLVAVTHISNALGTINPVRELIRLAHAHGAPVLVDGAQAVPHASVDVQSLDCDFYAFSGHKLYGPTGIGALYAKSELLEDMPPYQGGGEMIREVSFEKTTYADPPHKFEAGTPHIVGAIGLGVAVDYIDALGIDKISRHEAALLDYAVKHIGPIPGIRLVGTAPEKAGILSFVFEDIHAHDVGTILDNEGVAVRAGHHCAMPLMERFGLAATVRASFGLYNTTEDIDALIGGLVKVREVFGR